MSAKRVSHRIERTRNKHSRAVFRNGTIVIRLARNLSTMEEREHIENLLRRMTQQILEEKQKITVDPFRPLLNGGQSLTVQTATGKRYRFSLKAGKKTSVVRNSRGWTVTVGPHLRRAGLHQLLWDLLSSAEEKRIALLVLDINYRSLGAHIRKIRLKFASSQWGSCSPQKIIMLNAALLFTPPSVLRYVIVHELAHLRHGNHSGAYWREVERMLPSYKKGQTLLKEYRLPSL